MLHQLLVVELPDTALRYALAISFDDLLLLATLPDSPRSKASGSSG